MLNKELQTYLNKNLPRVTAFTFVFYPSDISFDDDLLTLQTFLSFLGVPSCVSPLHDKDIDHVDLETGETILKPLHFHVVIDFGNNKTIEQCFELINPIRKYVAIAPFDKITSPEDPELPKVIKVWKSNNVVRNMRTLLRYFKHLDNPEKYQYVSAADVYLTYGGFDLDNRLYSQSDCYVILDEIQDFIDNNQVYSFCDLARYCRKNNREWYCVLVRAQFTLFITNYIKSFTFEDTGALNKKIEKYVSEV